MNLEKRHAKVQNKIDYLRRKIDELEDLEYELYREIHKNDPPRPETPINKITKEIYAAQLTRQLKDGTKLITWGGTTLVTDKFVEFPVPRDSNGE